MTDLRPHGATGADGYIARLPTGAPASAEPTGGAASAVDR